IDRHGSGAAVPRGTRYTSPVRALPGRGTGCSVAQTPLCRSHSANWIAIFCLHSSCLVSIAAAGADTTPTQPCALLSPPHVKAYGMSGLCGIAAHAEGATTSGKNAHEARQRPSENGSRHESGVRYLTEIS